MAESIRDRLWRTIWFFNNNMGIDLVMVFRPPCPPKWGLSLVSGHNFVYK